ncbi:hypothetical protein MPSEU_000061800 [Mayamaea pseudoterrestris]|nr:hypothetical protein MPSEU_000061800 [Mayamaea pseudoterrestris]
MKDAMKIMLFWFTAYCCSLRVVHSFTTTPLRNTLRSSTTTILFADFLKQQPHESDAQFMARLRVIVSDPETFARAVRGEAPPKQGSNGTNKADSSSWNPTSLHTSAPHSQRSKQSNNNNGDYDNNNSTDSSNKRKGYQKVEDWEHDQQQLLEEMTWEQRVQYEGQRDGNRIRQDVILRNSIKRW